MTTRKIFLASVFLSAIVAGVYSCRDLGDTPPRAALSASVFSVSLAPGGTANVTISGGNPPYSITRQPSASLAIATLTGNADGTANLRIQATAALVSGRDSVKMRDSDTHGAMVDNPSHEENEITIQILINPPSGTVLFSTQVQPIFTNSCAVPTCHVSGGTGPMTLTTGTSRGNLVDRDMLNASCGGKRVVAGNAGASGLVKKLEGNCGARMPLGSPTGLPAAEITLIRDWISQGAQPN